MLAMDLVDRRTMWRDYWIEWVLAALLDRSLNEWPQWRVAALDGARPALHLGFPPILISVSASRSAAWHRRPDRPLEARAMKASALHRRPPVDHLLAADDAGRRRPGGGRRRC